jgi:hypothetical protein
MRYTLIYALLFLSACGGNLSDEQRKKLKERSEEDRIQRVSEGELLEASFTYGRNIAAIIEKRDAALSNRQLIDSLESAFEVKIFALVPGDSLLREIESRIIEAYTSAAGQVTLADDVQKLSADSMLYTKPILRDRPDGSVEFTSALGIRMPVRPIILSLPD